MTGTSKKGGLELGVEKETPTPRLPLRKTYLHVGSCRWNKIGRGKRSNGIREKVIRFPPGVPGTKKTIRGVSVRNAPEHVGGSPR